MIDAPTIAAGFLHDTVEDCKDITLDTIRAEFGEEVAQLVDGVTKLDKLDFTNREEQKAESLRKMILAMSKDIRVVIIKLADRLHNMRTLRFQPEERQKAIAHETLDIYAPLAHRLGMNSIKSELEDLSFKYIDPDAFHDIAQKVGLRRTEREETHPHGHLRAFRKARRAAHPLRDGRPAQTPVLHLQKDEGPGQDLRPYL